MMSIEAKTARHRGGRKAPAGDRPRLGIAPGRPAIALLLLLSACLDKPGAQGAATSGEAPIAATGPQLGASSAALTSDPDGGPATAPPTLALDAPTDGTATNAASVAVAGRVLDGEPPFTVVANGTAAAVSDRGFSVGLALAEGDQTIQVTATDALGRTASAQRKIKVDRTAPSVTVTRPATASEAATESPYLVTGTVGDVQLASVTVGGQAAVVVGGQFGVAVPLVAGEQDVEIVARDLAGNETRISRHLTVSGLAPTVRITSPVEGASVSGTSVTVRAEVSGTAAIQTVDVGAVSATDLGNGTWEATVAVGLGATTLTVHATDAAGMTGIASVTVRGADPQGVPLEVVEAEPVTGATAVEPTSWISFAFNKALVPGFDPAAHLQVTVDGQPIAGTAAVGPGSLALSFVPSSPLPEGRHVEVELQGVDAAVGPGLSDHRTAFDVRPAQKVVRGLVLDAQFEPIEHAKVELVEVGQSTETGADGNWMFIPRARGLTTIRVTGGTSSDGRAYPTVLRQAWLDPQNELSLPPLILIPTDGKSARVVSPGAGLHVEFGGSGAGVVLDADPGVAMLPDGATSGFLTATRVPGYAVPRPTELLLTPGAMWQLGPAGVVFSGASNVSLRLPNEHALPAGRHVVYLGSGDRGDMRLLGLGHVTADGTGIVSENPLTVRTLDYFGYVPVTAEQDAAIVAAAPAAPAGIDGGSGWLEKPVSPFDVPVWDWFVPAAHAQFSLAGGTDSFLSQMGALQNNVKGPALITGWVRTPHEGQLTFGVTFPNGNNVPVLAERTPPVTLSLKVKAHAGTSGEPLGAPTQVRVSGKGPDGTALLVSPVAELSTLDTDLTFPASVSLPLGKSNITVVASTLNFGAASVEYEAEVFANPSSAPVDGGTPPPVTYGLRIRTLRSNATAPDARDFVAFPDVPVNISGYGVKAQTGLTGKYALPMTVSYDREEVIATSELPLGYRAVETVDANGIHHRQLVPITFIGRSPMFEISPNATVQADVLVDVRVLAGAVVFVDGNGKPLPPICDANKATERAPATGDLTYVSEHDVKSTEVHFFREDDLEHPIAKYAVTTPELHSDTSATACDATWPACSYVHGHYDRVRVGPLDPNKDQRNAGITARCESLELTRTEAERNKDDFYVAECKANRNANLLRLHPGDRVVVFAVNHATGHAGMTTVEVPKIAAACWLLTSAADRAACTKRELTIRANLKLFPPQLDMRVERATRESGMPREGSREHLVRTGGAATTHDDYLKIETHWRVRRTQPWGYGTSTTGAADGGTVGGASEDQSALCDALVNGADGGMADGGLCPTCGHAPVGVPDGGAGPLVDTGDAGTPLEVLCGQQGAEETSEGCLPNDDVWAEVPAGVPPLRGRLWAIGAGVSGLPAVFDVKPGRNSVFAAVGRHLDATTDIAPLLQARYFVHVVGAPVQLLDTNYDGFVSSSETSAGASLSPPVPDWSVLDGGTDGLPGGAIVLKNVYRAMDPGAALRQRYDRAREHEFSVMDVAVTSLQAVGADGGTRNVLTATPAEAWPTDTQYDYAIALTQPSSTEAPARRPPPGPLTVRLGTDADGITCTMQVSGDPGAPQTLSGSCGGDSLQDVLSAGDLLYLDLFYGGNSENTLARFNFAGISKRRDYLVAGSLDTAATSVLPATQKKLRRPVSQPALVHFSLNPEVFPTSVVVQLCLDEACQLGLKSTTFTWSSTLHAYVLPPPSGTSQDAISTPFYQHPQSGSDGSRYFSLALPANMVSMPGSGVILAPIYLKLGTRPAQVLGNPIGEFVNVAPNAVGQLTFGGVNVVDGHLTQTFEDLHYPEYGGVVQFVRTYNNQNNEKSPLGRGWSHNFDGRVIEEYPGRYVVIVGGQGRAFPACTVSGSPGNNYKIENCTTDGSHGGQLTATTGGSGVASLSFLDESGIIYEFGRFAGEDVPGRRVWRLTGVDDGHDHIEVRYEGARGDAPVSHVVWPKRSTPDIRKDTYVELEFKYGEGANHGTVLQQVCFKRAGTCLDAVDFEHDMTLAGATVENPSGNLTAAVKCQNKPATRWQYTYANESDAQLRNELRHVEFRVDNYVQWKADFAASPTGMPPDSNGPVTPVPHVRPEEAIAKATLPGQGRAPLEISGTGSTRAVKTPGVTNSTAITLNAYGNAIDVQGWKSTWGSDSDTGNVRLSTYESPVHRIIGFDYDPRLRLKKETLKTLPTGVEANPSLTTNAVLHLNDQFDARWGIPQKRQELGATGPRDYVVGVDPNAGAPSSVTGSGFNFGSTTFDPALGLPTGGTLDTGDTVSYSLFSKSSPRGNVWGLPSSVTVTLAGAGSPDASASGRKTRTMELTYDDFGNLATTKELETKAESTNAYDGLHRLTSHTATDERPASFNYLLGDNELTVVSNLATMDSSEPVERSRTQSVDGQVVLKKWKTDAGEGSEAFKYSGVLLESTVETRIGWDLTGNTPTTSEVKYNTTFQYDNEGRRTKAQVAPLDPSTLQPSSQPVTVSQTEYDAEGKPTSVTDALGLRTTLKYDALGRNVGRSGAAGMATESSVLDPTGGWPTKTMYGNGHVMTYTFDAAARMLTVKSGDNSIDLTMSGTDAAGRIDSVTDNVTGLKQVYERRDVLGRITKSIRSFGTASTQLTVANTYSARDGNKAGEKVSTTQTILGGSGSTDLTSTTELDGAMRPVRVEALNGARLVATSLTYNEFGQLKSRTVNDGGAGAKAKVQYGHDVGGILTSVTIGDGSATTEITFKSDTAGNVVATTRSDGTKESVAYDGLNRPTSRALSKPEADGGTSEGSGISVEPGGTWTYEYGTPDGGTPAQVTVTPPAPSGARTLILDEYGRVTSVATTLASNGSLAHTFAYDGDVLVSDEEVENATDADGGVVSQRTTTRTYRRDMRGRLLQSHTTLAATDISEDVTRDYDWADALVPKVTSTWTEGNTSKSRTWAMKLDPLGNMLERRFGGVAAETRTYDTAGRLLTSTIPGQSTKSYDYGADGHLYAIHFGTETTKFGYDAVGRPRCETDASGRTAFMQYDEVGRLTRRAIGLGGNCDPLQAASGPGAAPEDSAVARLEDVTRYGYDATSDEQPVTITHGADTPDAASWHYTYGPYGEMTGVTTPDNQQWKYLYYPNGQLRAVGAPDHPNSQTFAYDALGRETLRTRGSTLRWTTTYDAGKASTVDADGNTQKISRDSEGRVLLRTFVPGPHSVPGLSGVAYAYDADGQITSATETFSGASSIQTVYGRDGRGRLTSINRPGAVVSYGGYTEFDAPTTVTSAHGTTIYGYDLAGRLASINDTAVTWEPGGRRLKSLDGGGLAEVRCYDGRGWLARVANVATPTGADPCTATDAANIQSYDYTYDGRGNRLSETFIAGVAPEVTTYGYDKSDRLTGVSYPDGTAELYLLSGSGSRLGLKSVASWSTADLGLAAFDAALLPDRHLSYGIDDTERLTSITDELTGTPAGTVAMDLAGRTTQLSLDGVNRTMQWDAADRMVSATVNGATTTYDYDHEGMRIAKHAPGEDVKYVWGAGELLEEQSTVGGDTSVFRYARQGELVAGLDTYLSDGTTVNERVLRDGLGSITGRFVTGFGQTAAHRFDAWGSYRNGTAPPIGSPMIGYTGHHWDPETALTYGKARWLVNGLGRWASVDPVGVTPERLRRPAGLNSFLYADNNPNRFVDVSGMTAGELAHWQADMDWARNGTLDRTITPESRRAAQKYYSYAARNYYEEENWRDLNVSVFLPPSLVGGGAVVGWAAIGTTSLLALAKPLMVIWTGVSVLTMQHDDPGGTVIADPVSTNVALLAKGGVDCYQQGFSTPEGAEGCTSTITAVATGAIASAPAIVRRGAPIAAAVMLEATPPQTLVVALPRAPIASWDVEWYVDQYLLMRSASNYRLALWQVQDIGPAWEGPLVAGRQSPIMSGGEVPTWEANYGVNSRPHVMTIRYNKRTGEYSFGLSGKRPNPLPKELERVVDGRTPLDGWPLKRSPLICGEANASAPFLEKYGESVVNSDYVMSSRAVVDREGVVSKYFDHYQACLNCRSMWQGVEIVEYEDSVVPRGP